MIWPIFKKSMKEQIRNYWVLLLTVSLAPFFVFVYYLINEASQPVYDVMLLNMDDGIVREGQRVNLGDDMIQFMDSLILASPGIPIKTIVTEDETLGRKKLEQKKVDALLVLPADFSKLARTLAGPRPDLEISGDLSSIPYMISAIWLGEMLNEFMMESMGQEPLYTVRETALGRSGQMSEFDLWMPGMLILSIIMLMFSATIAIITEVDQQTILRLKLSKMRSWEFLTGVGGIQVLVGILSILLTLASAASLGFEMHGSYLLFFLIALLTSISMIAFSLVLAALTRSVTDVLIVGNFPLFLFMFFTGAAFPMRAKAWFYIDGYGISWQSLMSPTHAINALNKVSILNSGIGEILPELGSLIIITAIYFAIGVWAFQKRHL
ncbi:MAG: ABC transporter permease [Candidatus Marinimicrobia bacterium]|nr:ABC transporter permease [Candidatus Neomarinimicrobiota bacterium]